MAEIQPGSGQVLEVEDFGKGKEGDVKRWKTELLLARKGPRKIWKKRYDEIVRRYRDERSSAENEIIEGAGKGFNSLWSNVRTTAPAIYARPPKVLVERRHRDGSLIARAACVILQRALMYQMSLKGGQFHRMMKACRLDFQLGAEADSRVRYEQSSDYHGGGDLSGPLRRMEVPDGIEAYENVVNERICWDYQHPDDILYSAGRNWEEVKWVAYRSHMTRRQVRRSAVFGDRADYIAKTMPFKAKPYGMSDDEAERPENGALMQAQIWAIFAKEERKIIYLCEDWDEILATVDDPSSLEDFFPSPAPARDTVTNDTMAPVPSYTEYKGQAQELDDLTRRASLILDAVRVSGVYDGAHEELRQLLDGGHENKLLPVTSWAEFAEKGGLDAAVDFLPIEQYAKVLDVLYRSRVIAKQDLDQMSGVFDVMRGQSNPNETLGAQKLKSGYSDMRSSEPKEEMARFARDNLAIGGELIAEHFSPAALWQMSSFGTWFKDQETGLRAKMQPPGAGQGVPGVGAGAPPPAATMGAPVSPQPANDFLPTAEQVFMQAVSLLRNEKLRGFVISVETDSTIEPDQQIEQARRTEFLTAVSAFLEKSIMAVTQFPQLKGLVGQMLLFGVRGFSVGSDLETAVEVLVQELENQPQEQEKPSPEQIKADAEKQKAQMEAQAKQQEHALRMQEMQAEIQQQQREFAMRLQEMQAEMAARMKELQMAIAEKQMDMQIKRQEAAITAESMERKDAYEQRSLERKAEFEEERAERDMNSGGSDA